MKIEEARNFIVDKLREKKARDILIYSDDSYSMSLDYSIIASGRSSRNVTVIAEHLSAELKAIGIANMVEGSSNGEWVFIAFDNINIHVFHPEVRSYYNIEELYNKRFAKIQQIDNEINEFEY